MSTNSFLRIISPAELRGHMSANSCWIAISGIVYDITQFLTEHPGGSSILLKYAGTDSTSAFRSFHPPEMVDLLPPDCVMGRFISSVSQDSASSGSVADTADNIPLSQILNCQDFAANARKRVSKAAWDYLVSGAEDEVTYRENQIAFERVWIKPRVLVNVSGAIDLSVNLFGSKSSCPIYVSATAMGRLYDVEGEVGLCKGCYTAGVVQMCPTLASCGMEEMAAARQGDQTQWFQLYINKDRVVTERIVRKAERLGMKVLVVTVDVAELGKRERDQRNKVLESSHIQKTAALKSEVARGVSKSLSSFIHAGFDWAELRWVSSLTKLPILIKGVQTAEDAELAFRSGIVQGLVVSNHGGRQVDYARPSLVCLEEISGYFKSKNIPFNDGRFDLFLDGGVRRGTDVFKALALGAKAVGIGRPALFALASHGVEGVAHLIDLLADELRLALMHVGCRSVGELKRDMVVAGRRGARGDLHESRL